MIKQIPGGLGHGRHGALERLGVVSGRGPEPADLPHVLQRCCSYVGLGHVGRIRLTECLDAAAHNRDATPPARARAHRTGIYAAPMTENTEFELTADLNVLRVYRAASAAKVELHRPERMNAWNGGFGIALRTPVGALGGDPDVRAVLVTGAGRGFSSGADLRDRPAAGEAGHSGTYTRLTELYHPIITRIRRMPKPVVAAVYGPAAGIGCSLALACDLIIAAESAYFLLAFVNIGLIPD